MNKVILTGRLGKDPTVKYLQGGTAVAEFSLATSESYLNKEGQKIESTEWHNIVMWRKQAETAEKFFKKGMLILVEGKLQTTSYEHEGVKKYTTKIVVHKFEFLESKKQANQQPQSQPKQVARQNTGIDNEIDDMPF